MKKPFIHMCGASDLKDLVEDFNKTIGEMNCEPTNYFDASSSHSNLQGWPQNSIEAIKDADIVVYVILDKYGSITWETEYAATLIENKQFVVLCVKRIFDSYIELSEAKESLTKKDGNLSKVYSVIENLFKENRTIAPFSLQNFKSVLKDELTQIFFRGLRLLKEEGENLPILNAIRNNDRDFMIRHDLKYFEQKALKRNLMDSFENKEYRKKILEYFSIKNVLSDTEIIKLLDDTEQGIRRKVYDNLPELLKGDHDINLIFKHIVSQAKKKDRDVAIDNRALPNMIKFDIKKAVESLRDLFPAKSINAPKKILIELDDNFDRVLPLLENSGFYESLCNLIKKCLDYNSNDINLKKLYSAIQNKIKNNGYVVC